MSCSAARRALTREQVRPSIPRRRRAPAPRALPPTKPSVPPRPGQSSPDAGAPLPSRRECSSCAPPPAGARAVVAWRRGPLARGSTTGLPTLECPRAPAPDTGTDAGAGNQQHPRALPLLPRRDASSTRLVKLRKNPTTAHEDHQPRVTLRLIDSLYARVPTDSLRLINLSYARAHF